MAIDPSQHYTGAAHHRSGLAPDDRARFEAIRNAIPDGVKRVLDCGCGTGNLGNLLCEDYEVVGCDLASPAFEHCHFETVPASLADLPFPDRAFDVVISSQVLEHILPVEFGAACREIQRVAARAIVMTVPNAEDLEYSRKRCRHCGTVAHEGWHVRSMNEDSLVAAFPEFRLVKSFRVGHKQRADLIWRTKLSNRLRGFRLMPPDRHCPLCGQYGTENGERDPEGVARLVEKAIAPDTRAPWVVGLRRAALSLVPGRRRWLGVLLERR